MRVLLLAGTSEARSIASKLTSKPGVELTASLAGATRHPLALSCRTISGGFGGRDGFRDYLAGQNIAAVIDATHPFAAKMSETAASVCRELAIPHLQMLRPAWTAGPGDNWHEVERAEDVAAFIRDGSTVFLATGRQSLPGFANLSRCRLICRQIDPPDAAFPYPNGEYLLGRPPFSVKDERELFETLAIDWLVVKNSGGDASRTKLDAARALGLPVVMIKRPKQPDCHRVQSVPEALAWFSALSGSA